MAKRPHKSKIKPNVGGGQKAKQPGNTPLTQPYDRPEARRRAKADARQEYNPVIRGIKSNLGASRNRQKEVGQWFNTLGGQINEAAAQTDASYSQADAAMKANIDAATAAAMKNQGNVAAQDANFAALTGADPGSFSETAQTMNAGADQRAIAGAALAAPIAAAGANQAGYLRNTGITARREGIQQKLLEAKRRRAMGQDLVAARKERSQKAVANFGEIRQGEIDNQIKRKAFNLEKSSAAADAAAAAAAAKQQREENEEDNETSERNDARGNGGGDNGLTPTQKRDARRENQNAMTAARTLYKAAGSPDWNNKQWTLFIQRVAMEEGIDYTAAKKAVNRLRKKADRPAPPPKIDAPSPLG